MKWLLPLLLLTLPAMAQPPACPAKTREGAFYHIGLLHARGDTRGALAALGCLLQETPRDPEALLARGQIHLEIGNRDAALADFNVVLELHPAETRALIGRGLVAMANGWYDLAYKDFDSAVQSEQTSAPAYFHRGQMAAKLGEPQLALHDLRTALYHGFQPEREALWQIALIYRASGDLASYEASLRQVIALDRQFAPAFEHLGELLAERGDISQGFAYLHHAHLLQHTPLNAVAAPPPDPAAAARRSFLQWMPLMLVVLMLSGLMGGALAARRRSRLDPP